MENLTLASRALHNTVETDGHATRIDSMEFLSL